MLPILYSPSAISDTNSETNKFNSSCRLGFVRECISCSVTEERNGSYELTMTVATSDRLAKDISVCGFVMAKANPQDNPQIFEIYKVSFTDTTMTVNAQHVRYLLNNNVIWVPEYSGSPAECWEQAAEEMEGTNYFTFSSDITSELTVGSEMAAAATVGEWLMGTSSSMLDVFGGEYHFDNFAIELLESRGAESGVCLRYGSNISSYSQEASSEKLYTAILPYVTELATADEDGNDLGTVSSDLLSVLTAAAGVEINSLLVSIDQNTDSPLEHYRILSYDFTEKCTNDGITLEYYQPLGTAWQVTEESALEVLEKLKAYAESYASSNADELGSPSFSVTVNTPEGLDSLSECALCDTVSIYYPPTGTTAAAKIVAAAYDSLNERYTSLELGTVKRTIADLISVKNIGGV